jgi:hypothetical protein
MTMAIIPISTERPANRVSDMSRKPFDPFEADRTMNAEVCAAALEKLDGVVTALVGRRGMIYNYQDTTLTLNETDVRLHKWNCLVEFRCANCLKRCARAFMFYHTYGNRHTTVNERFSSPSASSAFCPSLVQ